ncbi:MAG TPA: hypothetical protein VNG89_03930, partial [Vicinamibacterales bacterium]|nr:hypothetical protein [Vicinamibacterales bacterium]
TRLIRTQILSHRRRLLSVDISGCARRVTCQRATIEADEPPALFACLKPKQRTPFRRFRHERAGAEVVIA